MNNQVIKKCDELRFNILQNLMNYFGEESVILSKVDDSQKKSIYKIEVSIPKDKNDIRSLMADIMKNLSPSGLIGERILHKSPYVRDKKMIFKLTDSGSLQVFLPEDDYLQHKWAEFATKSMMNVAEILSMEYTFQSIYSKNYRESTKKSVGEFKSYLDIQLQ